MLHLIVSLITSAINLPVIQNNIIFRWLMISCTDGSGGQVKTQIVSIDVPNKYFSVRRKTNKYFLIGDRIDQNGEKVANNFGLVKKIWDYCAETASILFPSGGVRLVVTRVGRIGAGETKEWCNHFGKNIKKKKGSEKGDKVEIISASLTSLEPDVTIRVIPEQTRSTMAGLIGKTTVIVLGTSNFTLA